MKKNLKKIVAFIITLVVVVFGTTENPVKNEVIAGFSTMRGFATLQSDDVLTNIVTVSSTSFADLATTSIELLPAPGDGRINQIIAVTGYRSFSSESWNNQGAQKPTIAFDCSCHLLELVKVLWR